MGKHSKNSGGGKHRGANGDCKEDVLKAVRELPLARCDKHVWVIALSGDSVCNNCGAGRVGNRF
jgi:hypothetical protein